MIGDLSRRAIHERELMDDPDADLDMLERTYRRFAIVNAVVSRRRRVYRREIRPRVARNSPVRVLDIGSGGADMARAIVHWAHRDGASVDVTALDLDPRAVSWARANDTGDAVHHRCASSSALADAGEKFDVVLSNHLLHHLDETDRAALLADSERLVAPGGVALHCDIERSRLAYASYDLGTALFARTVLAGSFIRADGLTSIRRSYTAAELVAVAPPGWHVERTFPARLALRHEQPA
ncbi:methyltransferase domain-containing protein [uncultured Microbacterium sp.]|uniref:methyltransferase domain-containing protein n=1 Tax=uncultured Microbacterium sp. TaxID=191216 RepID=UPI002609EE73|nr:methyltransferase domain-containing protein [uncultured Microbacterium sp.]